MNPTVVIISGPPASGKTTIVEKIAQTAQLPIICKDAIKELLFDALGWEDRDWSQQLGATTYRLFDYFGHVLLSANQSFLIESNFKKQFDQSRFDQWQKEFNAQLIQVYCTAPVEVLQQRFRDRVTSGRRHPGHVDEENSSLFQDQNFAELYAPLDIAETLTYNSSDPDPSHQAEIIRKVTALIRAK